MVKTVAIVAAAGEGRRMGGSCKVLLSIAGKDILRYSIELFEESDLIDGICVVVPPERLDFFTREYAARLDTRKIIAWVAGGPRRQDSVAAALGAIPREVALIAVHDGARPLAGQDLLGRVVAAARTTGAAIPGVGVTDTIKEVAGTRVIRSLPREHLRVIQTPQVFAAPLLREAYARAAEKGLTVTDDAMLVESLGREVTVVEGSRCIILILLLGFSDLF
ncbi:MAG: 2-C-methyl-D-erythritol 4-phosphate cytidylyltransferase [Candidatus Aureabacteria bacterium]|nr:2-C-methyl-D-erythritol 4-phosphate cytidylyltransferase [Candidatus Auribacterota bacterium]